MRKLKGEFISPTRPKCHAVLALASQAAVAVKLNFIKPFLAFGDVLDGEGIHWPDKLDERGGGGVVSSCFHLKLV